MGRCEAQCGRGAVRRDRLRRNRRAQRASHIEEEETALEFLSYFPQFPKRTVAEFLLLVLQNKNAATSCPS
jgi:hypothetical protein